VERFGANRQAIDRQIDAVDAVEEEARKLYLVQDMDGAEKTSRTALQRLGEAEVGPYA